MEYRKYKNFAQSSKNPWRFDLPNLIDIQTKPFEWFTHNGLRELFDEISPIEDYQKKDLELYFLDYYFDEPKRTPAAAKENNLTYEAPLRCKVRLKNKRTGELKEQEIYLGDFPVMTAQGTFIINGVERILISQFIRSSGVFFVASESSAKNNYFGSKIIPARGAWLEFDTDASGVISVKIDKKRKLPVTSLLRIFGLGSNEAITKAFRDTDTNKDFSFIAATLAKDPAKNVEEAYLELYKRIRPGDMATPENAKQLIDAMFSIEKYDLQDVGRWKMDQRLGIERKNITPEDKILHQEDLVKIVAEMIRLNNNPKAEPDDIDHLGNRRVRHIGELLQNRLRVGFVRMERIIKDRMSTLDLNTVTPAQLINSRPLISAVKEFFNSSQLSQFMDQVNPLAELEHKRRVSALGPGGLTRERAGFEVRDVHASHYGRICPIETPEGPNIGLISYLAGYSKLNDFGFLETPYRKVINGKLTGEIHYLNALEEEKFIIAHGGEAVDDKGVLTNKKVEARVKGDPELVDREEVDYMDVAPQQAISVATSLIPFLEHDDAQRALMGSNMQRQAVSCIKPQAPRVGTGVEKRAAYDSGKVIISDIDGIVAEVDANHITVKPKEGAAKIYFLENFERSNQYTTIHQHPLVHKGDVIKKGDALTDGPAIDKDSLALGQNLLVAFMPFEGLNYEDAIIISERVLKDDRFTSIHIENFSVDVRETKLGPEITTPDIPNVGEEKLKDLDEEGIVRIGAEVHEGDILVGKISFKGEADLTPEERLLRAIFGEKAREVKDTSLTLPHGKSGRVVGVKILSREKGDELSPGVIKTIQIEVAEWRKVSAGDKLSGRHGNKGVISAILPEEDMPYLENGTPVDVILNPLGVISRMNIGQILETHLGWAAEKLDYYSMTPALDGANEEQIKEELKKADIPESGKVTLYNGKTGEPFEQKVTVGINYMMKLNHLVEDKLHMRSIGPYSLITQQPLGGKAQFGGQRLGEMEVWALEGYGVAHILQEMLTVKSDDVAGRTNTYESIIKGENIKYPNIPAAFNVLINEIKGLGLNVQLLGGAGKQRLESEEEDTTINKTIEAKEPVGKEVAESERTQ